jgi:hypothetical protein
MPLGKACNFSKQKRGRGGELGSSCGAYSTADSGRTLGSATSWCVVESRSYQACQAWQGRKEEIGKEEGKGNEAQRKV